MTHIVIPSFANIGIQQLLIQMDTWWSSGHVLPRMLLWIGHQFQICVGIFAFDILGLSTK